MPGPRYNPHSCGPFSGFAGPLTDALVAPALDLERLDVAEIKRRFGNGTLTSAALVKAYLDRIRFVNQQGPGIDAVRPVNPAAATQAAAADAARARGDARARWPASRCWSTTRSTSPGCPPRPARWRWRT